MNEKKLRNYLSTKLDPPKMPKILKPVILSDSKGGRLRNVVNGQFEQNIVWWCKLGDNIQSRITWLYDNLKQKIRLLGQIHLYVWLVTCDLTTRDKSAYISITTNPSYTLDHIIRKYREIANIIANYPGSKVTFLSMPVYSIVTYNPTRGHLDSQKFTTQDTDLLETIHELNLRGQELNKELGTISPSFNRSLYANTKHRTQDKKDINTLYHYSLQFYTDCLHPVPLLSRVWLKKLAMQIKHDSWL